MVDFKWRPSPRAFTARSLSHARMLRLSSTAIAADSETKRGTTFRAPSALETLLPRFFRPRFVRGRNETRESRLHAPFFQSLRSQPARESAYIFSTCTLFALCSVKIEQGQRQTAFRTHSLRPVTSLSVLLGGSYDFQPASRVIRGFVLRNVD